MANGDNIKFYSAADIERYHQGKLSPQERNALEKAALDDPFLADALEGYAVAGTHATTDLKDLSQRLAQRIQTGKLASLPSKNKKIPWMRIAAMLVILVGAAILANELILKKTGKNSAEITSTTPADRDTKPVGTDTVQAVTPGTAAITPTDSGARSFKAADEKSETAKVGEVSGNKDLTGPVTTPAANATTEKPVEDQSKTLKNDVAGSTTRSAEKTTDREEQKSFYKNETDDKSALAKQPKQQTNAPAKKEGKAEDNLVITATETKHKQQPVIVRGIASERQNNDNFGKNYYAMNTFRGQVTDNNNRGLPFANVMNTRDNVGTYTDVNGNFVLTSTDSTLNVQVRSLGYLNNSIDLKDHGNYNKVVMQDDRSGVEIANLNAAKPNAERRRLDANMKLEEPEPADGWENYDVYLLNNLNKPDDADFVSSGKKEVEISFEVDKNGNPTKLKIEKSLCKSCDAEAKRLIKEGPKFKRNAKKGRTTVKITF